MPGVNVFLDGTDFCSKGSILTSKSIEAEPRHHRDAIVCLVRDDLEQFGCPIAALGRDDAELRHMPADRIRQHRSLTNQKLPATMQHQARLLLFRFCGNETHRWSRYRLADGGRIVGVILAALEVGLHVARWHQL